MNFMSRLTTNKPVSEMGMLELAYNSCYIDEDGCCAKYRDFNTNMDARELARDLMREYNFWEIDDDEMLSDEIFDATIMENLKYGTKELEGLIALFYRNLWAMAELRERLKYYEDLADNGRLVELPCRVEDKAYHIIVDRMAEPSIYISVHEIKDVSAKAVYFADDWWAFEEMPELNAFLSKEEAEKALEEMRCKNE